MNYLAIGKFLIAVAPLFGQLIDILDAAMPAGTPGKAKLDAFQALLRQAVAAEQSLASTFDAAWPMVSQLVTSIVAVKKTVAAPK